jgi:hypothetical protein
MVEYEEDLSNFADEYKSDIGSEINDNNLNDSPDIELDSLLSFLNEPELRIIYKNHERVKNIIVIQCLYYFNIFRNLYLFKNKSKTEICDDNVKNEGPNFNKTNNRKSLQPLMRLTSHGKINNRENTISYEEINLPIINHTKKSIMKSTLDKQNEKFKVGIIGCGRVGTELARHLIGIRDSSLYSGFQIMISTRRPECVNPDVLSSIDENIEVFLDNEKIFNEAHLIFLCILPHTLDIILKEVGQTFKERIEKIKKKKILLFPTVVSVLSAVTIERLNTLFPEEVNVQRTYIFPSLFKQGKLFRSDSINEPNVKRKNCRFKIESNHYVVEAARHLFNQKFQENNVLEYILNSFHLAFFQIKKKIKEIPETTTNKFQVTCEENYSYDLLRCILLEEEYETVIDMFEARRLKQEYKENIFSQCQKNFILIVSNIIKILNYH